MNTRRYRAWRFFHPDLDVPVEFSGLGISPTGGIDMVEDEASIRQALLLLLSTMPGERVMRPEYGCSIQKLIFSPNDDTTAGLAIHYVRQAVERWEPRIRILKLDAGESPEDPGRLDIRLEYRVRSTQQDDRLTFSVFLSGEEA